MLCFVLINSVLLNLLCIAAFNPSSHFVSQQFLDSTIEVHRQFNKVYRHDNTAIGIIQYDYTDNKDSTIQLCRRLNLQTILYSNTDNTTVPTIKYDYTDQS